MAATHDAMVGQGARITRAQFFTINARACNVLMDRYNLEASVRVDPSVYLEEALS